VLERSEIGLLCYDAERWRCCFVHRTIRAARWRARLAQLSSEIEVRIWPEIRKAQLFRWHG
jgi:hypothetical protein